MQPLLEYIVRGLVDRPEDVSVSPRPRDGTTIYEIRLHPDDVGKIIGKQGATIQAVRALLQVASAKQGQRSSIEIVEEEPANY